MAGSTSRSLEVIEDSIDLDVIPLSDTYTVMRGRTFNIQWGGGSHYAKVTVVEQKLPDESEQEFRDRMDLLINREAEAERSALMYWIKEAGL